MSKFIVYVREDRKWAENGDGPLSHKEAERIARDIRRECGCQVLIRAEELGPPANEETKIYYAWVGLMGNLHVEVDDTKNRLEAMNSPSCLRVIGGIEAKNYYEAEAIAKQELSLGHGMETIASQMRAGRTRGGVSPI